MRVFFRFKFVNSARSFIGMYIHGPLYEQWFDENIWTYEQSSICICICWRGYKTLWLNARLFWLPSVILILTLTLTHTCGRFASVQISAILRIAMLFSTMISIQQRCNFFPPPSHYVPFIIHIHNDDIKWHFPVYLFFSCFAMLHSPIHTYRSNINVMHAHTGYYDSMEFLRFHFQSQKSKTHCPVHTVSVHMPAKHITHHLNNKINFDDQLQLQL